MNYIRIYVKACIFSLIPAALKNVNPIARACAMEIKIGYVAAVNCSRIGGLS